MFDCFVYVFLALCLARENSAVKDLSEISRGGGGWEF